MRRGWRRARALVGPVLLCAGGLALGIGSSHGALFWAVLVPVALGITAGVIWVRRDGLRR